MTARTRWISLALGALLLLGAPAVWFLSQPAPTAGELPDSMVVEPNDANAGSDVSEPPTNEEEDDSANIDAGSDTDDSAPDSGDVGQDVTDTESTTPSRTRAPKPVGVSVPSIGVDDAQIVEVGLDDDRAVEIPDDVSQVGWYNRGPRPGEDGNAFMTSHVDSRTQGRGVLFDLRRSEPGDLIVVTHEDGTETEWEVVFRERIVKGSYPMERVFRFDGPPGLVIDTCGGPFDSSTGSYENIDIVYAVPLGADADTTDLAASSIG